MAAARIILAESVTELAAEPGRQGARARAVPVPPWRASFARRTSTRPALLAFLFTSVIVALLINTVASLLR